MRFRLLGALDVEREAGPVDLGPHKQRSVLAILLLHANEIVPTERIVDLVWGESAPRTAEHSVQIYVSQLRRALANGVGPDLIETRAPGYVLHASPDAIDLLRFEMLVGEGMAASRSGDSRQARTKLETALDSWTGDPLADFSYDEFAQGYIRSLWELRTDALEALARIHLDQGDLDTTRRLVQEAIAADPLREEARRLMMLALYRSGRQAEALRHYAGFRALLGEELGIEPSQGLRDLEERILIQEPSLGLPGPISREGNPYRGLRPFSEEDADVFFGRESLVAEVLDKLNNGLGLVSIVGPSGSGKSSAARAGVVPELRRRGTAVRVMQPGARPLWELAGVLDRLGVGSRTSLLHRFQTDSTSLAGLIGRPMVLVVDQFEELFTLADTDAMTRFAELISRAIRAPESPLRVITTLRADYYDKPLLVPELADLFLDSVVNVKPMTPHELDLAVVEPARIAGVGVEPALLAQLVADMKEEPGALPLLQVTLFELFEQTSGDLTLAGYGRLGGLHGALARGAEELLVGLDPAGRNLVEQLMMRMVHKGQVTTTARPVLLRELLDLDVDNVLLQRVLEAFASQRLLTFDRDSSGSAVVEMAHEYLISEWPRMTEWIGVHSVDLERIRALDVAAFEWVDAGRSPDYLLRGERLRSYQSWSETTSLCLTRTESEFIDMSLRLRDEEERRRLEAAAKEESLARSARFRLWAFGVAIAILAAAITILVMVLIPDPPPDAIVWFDGRGDGSFGDLIGAGIDMVKDEYDLEVLELAGNGPYVSQIEDAVSRGTSMVYVDWIRAQTSGNDLWQAMLEHPDVQFVLIDCVGPRDQVEVGDAEIDWPSNASCITVANDEMGFVAGAAAALVTETGHVGFVGGTTSPIILDLQAGFEAGVNYSDDEVQVEQIFLSNLAKDMSAFASTPMGEAAAGYLIGTGADVVFHAAGFSGWGVFGRVTYENALSENPIWAVGVDVDQAAQVQLNPTWYGMTDEDASLVQGQILTSVRKRLDLGMLEAMRRFRETGDIGEVALSLGNQGIDYTTTGGHIDPYMSDLDAAIQAVVDGAVTIDVADRESPNFLLDLIPSS